MNPFEGLGQDDWILYHLWKSLDLNSVPEDSKQDLVVAPCPHCIGEAQLL